uniref:Uncharacterized protein n=1 Tax=Anguilla anguilla TaxID=7936 RepID=A0A0E9T5T5_ANGAN
MILLTKDDSGLHVQNLSHIHMLKAKTDYRQTLDTSLPALPSLEHTFVIQK